MTDETNTSKVATTEGNAPATLGGRLSNSMSAGTAAGPTPVLELMDVALGEGENSFGTDEYFEKAKGFLETVGLLDAYLTSKGIETEGNISEWRPTIVGLYAGKGNQSQTLGHLKLGTLFNHGTKTAIDLDTVYYPIFMHGEEILKDESGMNVEDRVTVPYNSKQEAATPGYDYQNIVYFMNQELSMVYQLSVKSTGHKFITNILRNYMLPNYKKGVMFNAATLKTWFKIDVTEHTSKSGFTNMYARLNATDVEVTSDEAKLINIMQRKTFDDFRKVLAKSDAEKKEANETQTLLDENTTTDAAGDNFTQL